LVAGSLIGNTFSTLKESCLTAFANGVDAVLVETTRGGNRGVVVHSLTTINSPVVVAVVVHAAMSIIHKTILTSLLGQCTVSTLVELIAVTLMWVSLEAVSFGTAGILSPSHRGCQCKGKCQARCEHHGRWGKTARCA